MPVVVYLTARYLIASNFLRSNTGHRLNLEEVNNMATESTEEHEKIVFKVFIFPCSSVDSVAIKLFCIRCYQFERVLGLHTR